MKRPHCQADNWNSGPFLTFLFLNSHMLKVSWRKNTLLESFEIPATDSRNWSNQVCRRVNAEFKTLGELCSTSVQKTKISRKKLHKNPCKKKPNCSSPGNKGRINSRKKKKKLTHRRAKTQGDTHKGGVATR